MTLDVRRNQVYWDALSKIITPESVVLDVGAGLGIHGLLAAKLGAKHVYLVEPEDVILVAEEIAKSNDFADRVTCLRGKIEEVSLPEQVDVITSVFTGNFLLEEDLLPSLFYARDCYLKPGGHLIPQAGVMEAVPVCAHELYEEDLEVWSQPHFGVDHSVVRPYVSQSVLYYRKALQKARYLAEPLEIFTLDFHHAKSTHCQIKVDYPISESGLCHGFAGWFKMQIGDTWLSTAPHEPPLHWGPAFLPLDPPIEVNAGDSMQFTLKRPPFTDWTWQVETTQTRQSHSTFLSVPFSLETIKKTAVTYQPNLNPKGKAAAYVLSHIDGSLSVEALSEKLTQTFPQTYHSPQKALKFVQDMINLFA
jgi:predicted RNA methylase